MSSEYYLMQICQDMERRPFSDVNYTQSFGRGPLLVAMFQKVLGGKPTGRWSGRDHDNMIGAWGTVGVLPEGGYSYPPRDLLMPYHFLKEYLEEAERCLREDCTGPRWWASKVLLSAFFGIGYVSWEYEEGGIPTRVTVEMSRSDILGGIDGNRPYIREIIREAVFTMYLCQKYGRRFTGHDWARVAVAASLPAAPLLVGLAGEVL